MAVTKRLRFEILRRDNYQCRYCGRAAPEVALTIDHVTPTALGGSDDPTNLVTACGDCNSGKSSAPVDAPLVADIAADAFRWARAMQQAASERAAARLEMRGRYVEFENEWNRWTADADGVPAPRPVGWENSIDQFIDAGLEMDDFFELAGWSNLRVLRQNRWRYFCGCCWSRVKELQARASEIVAGETRPTPAATRLTTEWTADQLAEYLTCRQQFAARELTQESIDSAHCPHTERGEGDCGDPVCLMMCAETLAWMADWNVLQSWRDASVMDALDEPDVEAA